MTDLITAAKDARIRELEAEVERLKNVPMIHRIESLKSDLALAEKVVEAARLHYESGQAVVQKCTCRVCVAYRAYDAKKGG